MSSFLSWVSGASTPNNSGRSIDLFLTQLESMPQLSDKRQSADDLVDAIKDAPDTVPSSVIPRLISIIGSGMDDEEIMQKILDILCFLTELKQIPNNETLLIENVSTLLSENSYVEVLLSLFDSPDVWTRLEAIHIVKNCITVNQSIVEKSILSCPMGLQKLVDILHDKREEVRNEVLLLLRSLTRRNKEICNFIAFQDGFDIIISILKNETGVVARDCLHVIYNMVANSVLTLKLFSQRKLLMEIVNVLSISCQITPTPITPTLPSSLVQDTDLEIQEPLGDRFIDLRRYGDLEGVSNVDIQCFQFAISVTSYMWYDIQIIELVVSEEIYADDAERMRIASPIIKSNRIVLHSNADHIFNLIYFTFFQLRQNTDEDKNIMISAQTSHNADDLLDLSIRCEPLLALCFRSEYDINCLQALLHVDVIDSTGRRDLLSFLLDGFLATDVQTVNSTLYQHENIFVRLFSLLFAGDEEFRDYLIGETSGCGEVLKKAFVESLQTLATGNNEKEHASAMNTFKLTSSVYLQCVETCSDGFLSLYVTDKQASFHNVSETVSSEAVSLEAVSSTKSEGCRLVTMLLDLLVTDRLSLDVATRVSHLLMVASLHATAADRLFDNLPAIHQLVSSVVAAQNSGLFLDTSFVTQLWAYYRLFCLLALLGPHTMYCQQYLQILSETIGLEKICNLAIRFFYLSKIREMLRQNKQNSMDQIGLDVTVLLSMESVYHQFKNTLFDFYINHPTHIDEDSQLVINSYKELIRIQDNDLRTIKLTNAGGEDVGIEMIEKFEAKNKEMDQLSKKLQDMEQEVFDWKTRFSEKEESLREKEQLFEQLEYQSKEEETRLQNLINSLQDQIVVLEKEKSDLEGKVSDHSESHNQELNQMMVTLSNKEEKICSLDETVASLEGVIRDLRLEIQNKNKEKRNNIEAQITKYKQDLISSQSTNQQNEKKLSTIQKDYIVLEEELEETKRTLVNLSSKRESKQSDYLDIKKENERMKEELNRIKTSRDDLQIMVNELQEEKTMMEELIRKSLTSTPTDLTPQIEINDTGTVSHPEIASISPSASSTLTSIKENNTNAVTDTVKRVMSAVDFFETSGVESTEKDKSE